MVTLPHGPHKSFSKSVKVMQTNKPATYRQADQVMCAELQQTGEVDQGSKLATASP